MDDTFKLRQKYTRFRILIVGRANAGKTTLLKRVCNTTEEPCIYDEKGNNLLEPTKERGCHDIHRPLMFSSNPNFIFHDSPGFEMGDNSQLEVVQSFIEERARFVDVEDQLHAIWLCLKLDKSRPLLESEQRFFNEQRAGNVPVIAIFTKFDDLIIQVFKRSLGMWGSREEAVKLLEDRFRAPLFKYRYPPKADVCMEAMHKDDGDHQKQVKELIDKTVDSLSDLGLEMLYLPDNDIKLFLQSGFEEIKQSHPLRNLFPPNWPSDSELSRLVQQSSGLFIYASTVMKYLGSPRHRPSDRLDIILGLSNPSVDTPFAKLDALYNHIFLSVEDINRVLEILSLLLLTQTKMEITPQLLEDLFFLRRGDIYIILSDLRSIMDVPTNETSVIRILHASLGDFLLDRSRSGEFHIHMGNAHANLTQYFLRHLSEIDPSMSKDKTCESFAYAFTMHCPLSSPTPELLDELNDFDFYMFLTTFGSVEKIKGNIPRVFDWLKRQSQNYPENLSSMLE